MQLTENARMVFERRYLRRDSAGQLVESPTELFQRVARAVAALEADAPLWWREFFAVMERLEFMPNSPALANAGRPHGQLSACFVLPVGDSLEQIFESVKWAAMIQQTGGGTGFSFSRLRPA